MARLFFPTATIEQMAQLGLKESDIQDVYKNGQELKLDSGLKGVEKKYYSYGYRIGFVYKWANAKDEYVVLKTWKKKTL